MSPLHVVGTLLLSILASTVSSHYVKGGDIDISQNTVAGTGSHGFASSSSFSSSGSYSQASSGSFQTAHVSGPIPGGVIRTQFANHPPLVHSAAVSTSGVGGSSQGHHASISSEINSGSVKSPIDASRNPYLNGQISSADLGPIPGCSGTSCSTEIKTHHFSSTEIKPVNVANNPYLNGEYKSGHISAGSFNQQYELGTGASQQIDVGKNPFLSGKVTGTQGQIPQHGAAGCGNAPGGSCLGTASVSLSKKPIDATNNPFLNQNYKSDTSGHFQQGSSGHSQQGSSGHSQQGSSGHSQHTLSGHAQQSLTGHGLQSSSGQAQQTGTSHQVNYENNPFLTGNVPSTQGHTTQSGSGCSGVPGGACSGGSGTYTGTNKQDNTLIHGQTSSSQGQFSQSTGGQTSSTGSGCTGAPGTPCSGSGNTLIIGSNNPFLSGQVPSSQGHFPQKPIGGHPSSSSSGCTGAPGSPCSDTGSSLTIGSNNPFLSGQKPANQGCDGKLGSPCSSGGTFTVISGQNNQLSGGHVGTSQGSNQLGGQSGPGCSGSPGSPGCSGSPSIISNNPFLNGQVPSSQGQNPYQPTEQGCGGLPGSSCTGSGQNKPISGGPINIGNNPFLNNNNNKPSQGQHFGSTNQQQQPINAGLNPFLSGQKPNQHQPIPSTIPGQSQQGPKPIPDHYPGQQQQKPVLNQFPGQPQPIPTTYPGQPALKGSSCSGAGYICIVKEKCINGLVNNYGQGLMQVRTSTQYCNPTTEVCCRLPNGPGTTLSFSSETQFKTDSQSSGGHSSSGFFSTNGNEIPQETVGAPVRSPFGNNALIPGSQISSGIINVPPKTNGGLIHIVPGPSPTFISPAELAGGRVQLPPGSKQGPAYIPPEPTPIQPKPTPGGPYRPSTLPPYQIQSTTYTPSTQPPNKFPPNQPPTQPPYTPSGSSLYPETRVPTSYLPPVSGSTTTQKPGNTYLPPYTGEIIDEVYLNTKTTPKTSSTTPEPGPAGSETKPNFLLPPTNPPVVVTRPPIETSTRPPIAPPTEPHAGCAAALKCVSIDHCTAEGVISETVVHLTREQHELRVPLTDCKDIDSGFIGKCCRDPTYKDPWPAGQLGLWNPNNGFDDGSYKSDKATNGRYKLNNNNRGPNFNGQVNLPTFIPGNEGRVPGNFNNVPKVPGSQTPGRLPGNQFPGSVPNFVGQGSNQFNVDRPYDPLPSASGTCGVRRYDSTPKGIGPLDASFGEIPWQAMILRDTNRSLLCGGAIIRPDAVITSARCVEGLPVNDILVKGGEWRLGIDEEPKPFQIIKVLTIVTHPEYASNTLMNDVAILFLAEKFRLDKHIDTICLPPENEQIEATYGAANCITTGWGKEVLRIHIQNSLPHRIGINLLQPSQCKSTLSTNYANQLYQYNQNSCVCGTPSVPNNDICDVDQGSALACDLGDGHYRLTGIYSWDTGCLAPGSTQIASFVRLDVPWINLVLGTPVQQFLQQSGSAVPSYSIPAPVKGRPHIHQQVPQPNYYQTQQQQHQQHIDSGVPCECEGK